MHTVPDIAICSWQHLYAIARKAKEQTLVGCLLSTARENPSGSVGSARALNSVERSWVAHKALTVLDREDSLQ